MKQLIIGLLGVVVLVGVLLVSNYNSIQTQDEAVTASASEMLNQYKRRADLIPNLVKTVQASSDFERQVLQDVVNARAKVGQMNINVSDLSDPHCSPNSSRRRLNSAPRSPACWQYQNAIRI